MSPATCFTPAAANRSANVARSCNGSDHGRRDRRSCRQARRTAHPRRRSSRPRFHAELRFPCTVESAFDPGAPSTTVCKPTIFPQQVNRRRRRKQLRITRRLKQLPRIQSDKSEPHPSPPPSRPNAPAPPPAPPPSPQSAAPSLTCADAPRAASSHHGSTAAAPIQSRRIRAV